MIMLSIDVTMSPDTRMRRTMTNAARVTKQLWDVGNDQHDHKMQMEEFIKNYCACNNAAPPVMLAKQAGKVECSGRRCADALNMITSSQMQDTTSHSESSEDRSEFSGDDSEYSDDGSESAADEEAGDFWDKFYSAFGAKVPRIFLMESVANFCDAKDVFEAAFKWDKSRDDRDPSLEETWDSETPGNLDEEDEEGPPRSAKRQRLVIEVHLT